MSVKIFFPRVPDNEDDFIRYVSTFCVGKPRFAKNKEGNKICILTVSFGENIHCANDLIDKIYGQCLNDIILKPKIHVDNQTLRMIDTLTFPPPSGVEEQVVTTHVEGKNYYIQLQSETELKIKVYNQLKILYQDFTANLMKIVDYDKVETNKIYATTFENDGSFHRIKIINKSPNKIEGFYIDFGNTDEVDLKKLVEINEEMREIPPLAHCCQIDGVEIENEEKHNQIFVELLHRRLKGRLIKKFDENYKKERVVAIDFPEFSNVSYREFLVGKGAAKVVDNLAKTKITFGKRDDILENKRKAVVAHYESLREFYVIIDDADTEEKMQRINTLIGKLANDTENAPTFEDETSMYLTKYSADGNWYRCLVQQNEMNALNKGILVQFIDFGNSEWKREASDLKLLSDKWDLLAEELASFKPCALQCSFEDDLVYHLQCAGVGKHYFQENFVNTFQSINVQFSVRENNLILVSNIFFDNGSDLLGEFEKVVEQENSDRFVLSCTYSINDLWFILVKSYNRTVQKNIENVRRCLNEELFVESVFNPTVNEVYMVSFDNDRRFRGKYLGSDRRFLRFFFQDIDTGFVENVKPEQVYQLPDHIANIEPLSKSYKFKVRSIVSEIDLLRNIKRTIGKNEVSLKLQNDDTVILDVIIKGKSLIKNLLKQDLIERDTQQLPDLLEESFRDILDGLKPAKGDSVDVDFTLPSIENMAVIPSDIKIKNAKNQMLRLMFSSDKSQSSLNEFFLLRDSTKGSYNLISIVNEVDIIKRVYLELMEEFKETCCVPTVKRKDLDSLIQRREDFCCQVEKLFVSFEENMKTLSDDDVTFDENKTLENLKMFISNLRTVYQPSANSTYELENINSLTEKINEFLNDVDYQEILNKSLEFRIKSDASISKLKIMMSEMIKEYKSYENITNLTESTPLIDLIYEVHTDITKEHDVYVNNLSENVCHLIDVCHYFLMNYSLDIEKVKIAYENLISMHETVKKLNNKNEELVKQIEENNQCILKSKKELRWAIVELEDAEDSENTDMINDCLLKVIKSQNHLHEGLRKSAEFIDENNKCVLMRKHELQLLNQSIILHEEEVPLFLWDIKYFNIKGNDENKRLTSALFENCPVKIQQLKLPSECMRSYLRKFHRVHVAASDDELSVKVIPIKYSFLSRTDSKFHFVLYPDFTFVTDIPNSLTFDLVNFIKLARDCLVLMTNLWHYGYIYSQEDLQNGFLIKLLASESNDNDANNNNNNTDSLYIPLPIDAIFINEISTDRPHLSIDTFLTTLYTFLTVKYAKCASVLEENRSNESLMSLINKIPNCKVISDVETLTSDFLLLLKSLNCTADVNESGRVFEDSEVVIEQTSVINIDDSVTGDNDNNDERDSSALDEIKCNGDEIQENREENELEEDSSVTTKLVMKSEIVTEEVSQLE